MSTVHCPRNNTKKRKFGISACICCCLIEIRFFFKLNFSSEVSYLQRLVALFQAILCQARAVHSATVLRWARNADAQVPKLVPNVVCGFLKTYFFVVSGCGPLPNVTDGLFTDCTDSLGKPIDTTFIKGNNVTVTYIRTIIGYFLIWANSATVATIVPVLRPTSGACRIAAKYCMV